MNTKRIWEIDAFRGVAIILMVFYHIIIGAYYGGIIDYPQITQGYWRLFAIIIGAMFIFLVGVSLTLSYSRIKNKEVNHYMKYFKRGLKIIGFGLLITIGSFILFKERFVYFGILQFIGTGIILAIPFLKLKDLNFLFGGLAIILGFYLETITIHSPALVYFGIRFFGMNTIDYYPIFPWFGILLFGIMFGNRYYPDGKRKLKIMEKIPPSRVLSFLGKHSLLIYFIHPIIIFSVIFIIQQF